MKTIVISEFKAKCIAVLNEAQRTKEPVIVTRRGRPIARVEPIHESGTTRQLGVLRGRMKLQGDIVLANGEADWEVLK